MWRQRVGQGGGERKGREGSGDREVKNMEGRGGEKEKTWEKGAPCLTPFSQDPRSATTKA